MYLYEGKGYYSIKDIVKDVCQYGEYDENSLYIGKSYFSLTCIPTDNTEHFYFTKVEMR